MDHCVCHAQRYADELTNYGIKNVRVIAPGIDLDHFSPKIKIGVVGAPTIRDVRESISSAK